MQCKFSWTPFASKELSYSFTHKENQILIRQLKNLKTIIQKIQTADLILKIVSAHLAKKIHIQYNTVDRSNKTTNDGTDIQNPELETHNNLD